MSSIYKYGERVWSDLLMSDGSVRIGTLHDYRESEHKRGISDPTEGKKSIHHAVEYYNSSYPVGINHAAVENISPFRSNGFDDCIISGINFVREFSADDCFIHCASYVLSTEVMAQFDRADSCVEIIRPSAFYKRLTEIINRNTSVHFYGLRRVIYANRNEAFNGRDFGVRPDLIKDPEFSPQYEVRAIWIPKVKKRIKPFSIQDKSLRKFCREVEVK